jgi:hypothetical protein
MSPRGMLVFFTIDKLVYILVHGPLNAQPLPASIFLNNIIAMKLGEVC